MCFHMTTIKYCYLISVVVLLVCGLILFLDNYGYDLLARIEIIKKVSEPLKGCSTIVCEASLQMPSPLLRQSKLDFESVRKSVTLKTCKCKS